MIIKKIQKKENIINNIMRNKYKFLNDLEKIPRKPPFLFGEIEHKGGFFTSNKRRFFIRVLNLLGFGSS